MPVEIKSTRLPVIDALRGLAAIAVALVHFTAPLKHSQLQRLCHYGWLGVDVFFVVSGFVIPLALAKSGYRLRNDYPRFLAKRLIRLHPPYMATVIVLLVAPLAVTLPTTLDPLVNFGCHALLLNGLIDEPWLINVFWSLAIEMQFYLFIGLAAPLLVGPPRNTLIALAAFLLLAILPVPKVWLPAHLPLFVFGILALMKTGNRISTGMFLAGLAATAAACTLSIGKPQALAGVATALIITHLHIQIPKFLITLGAVSYSLYLLHPVIGVFILSKMGAENFNSAPQQIMAVTIALLLSIAMAWIWFRVLESPCHNISSAIRYKSRSQSDSDAS